MELNQKVIDSCGVKAELIKDEERKDPYNGLFSNGFTDMNQFNGYN